LEIDETWRSKTMAGAAWGDALFPLRELFGGGTTGGLGDGHFLARYAASRDGAAFEVIVARHGPMVLAADRPRWPIPH
jgi:hypothetical protein